MPMTDTEARDLTEQVFAAMGWQRVTFLDWDGRDAGGHGLTPAGKPTGGWVEPVAGGVMLRTLPDIRTSACLPYFADWLDVQGLYWLKDADRHHRHAVRISPTPFEDEPYLSWDLVAPLTFYDTLGEAIGRAIVALTSARQKGEADND